jgi:hypothetical protein
MDDAKPDAPLPPPPQDATDIAVSSDHAKRRRLDPTRVMFMSFSLDRLPAVSGPNCSLADSSAVSGALSV